MCSDNIYLYNKQCKFGHEQANTVALERCPGTELKEAG